MRKKHGKYYKSSSTKSIRATIDHFLRLPPTTSHFLSSPTPLLPRQTPFRKRPKENGDKEQLKKLIGSGWKLIESGCLGSILASFLEDGDMKTSDS